MIIKVKKHLIIGVQEDLDLFLKKLKKGALSNSSPHLARSH